MRLIWCRKGLDRLKHQGGFTIIELACAIGLLGLIAGVLGAATSQLEAGSIRYQTFIEAQANVAQAGHWFTRDARMAQTTDLDIGGEVASEVTMAWMNRYQNLDEVHSIRYYLSNGSLMRDYDGQVITVARGISSLAFTQDDDTIRMKITSTPRVSMPSVSVQVTHEGLMRAVK